MRSRSNKACWNQQQTERLEPFSSSRQTTPIQIPVQQGQRYNYGDQRNKQNLVSTNLLETSSRPWETHPVQADICELGPQKESAPHHQIQYQRALNREQTNKEENILQQQARNAAQQKKITKTQAVQVNETNEGEGQINRVTLKRPVHQESMEEGCLQKEPFFINHYYSHTVGQCCCQQHAVSVKEGQITLQSSTTLNH